MPRKKIQPDALRAGTDPSVPPGSKPVSAGSDRSPASLPVSPDDAVVDEGPPEMLNGRPNIERLRWKFRVVADQALLVARGLRDGRGINFAQITDLFNSEAKNVYGIDPKHLMDIRTPEERMIDVQEKLAAAPKDILEEANDLLELVEERMDRADFLCGERVYADGTTAVANLSQEEQDLRAEKKRLWRDLISRAVRIQRRARDAMPKGTRPANEHKVKAAHILRLMLYVSRSGMPTKGNPDDIYLIGDHHARTAVAHYFAWNDLCLKDKVVVECKRWTGEIQVKPPGHSKTAFFSHVVLNDIAEQPQTKWHIYHASEKRANETLQFIGACLDHNEATGRRMLAIHPHLHLEQNTTNRIQVHTDEPQRAPTVASFGMTTRTSGTDALRVWLDDCVDQDATEQATEREYVFQRMNGTIKRRLRGQNTKLIVTATLYHFDDANSRMLEQVKNKKLRMVACVQRTGGPDSPVPFQSLWPEVYPTKWLKATYEEMRNPRLFAALFEANPQPDALRKIKKLAYFVPDEQHRVFMEDPATTFWVSIDPTASEEEGADKAAFIWGAIGDVVTETALGRRHDRRLRIIGYRDFHANQIQLTSELKAFAENHPVHHVLFEARSGFRAAADFWEHDVGLEADRIDPTNRKKGLRLGDVAPMIDASLIEKGLSAPVVEFLGKKDPETEQVWPDDEMKELSEQILTFGQHPEDHGVDAVTQLCKYLGSDLAVGEAAVTTRAQQMARRGDERLMRMFEQAEGNPDKKRNAAQDLWEYGSVALGAGR